MVENPLCSVGNQRKVKALEKEPIKRDLDRTTACVSIVLGCQLAEAGMRRSSSF